MSNTFGTLFRLTTFGESHGPAIGGIVDGCPAGIELDESTMQRELDLRRPGRNPSAQSGAPSAAANPEGTANPASPGNASRPDNPASTARNEQDRIRILSGVFEGRSTGTPIGFIIENKDHQPGDYEKIRDVYRPGHADYSWQAKYGRRDWRGGGRGSARETVARVAGGAVALALLAGLGVKIQTCTLAIGGQEARLLSPELAEGRPFGAPDPEIIPRWKELVTQARAAKDSLGGVVLLEASGLPPGLGEPVFDKLDARIGAAMFGVGAVKGVEIGAGFAAAAMKGSENNDGMRPASGPPPHEPNRHHSDRQEPDGRASNSGPQFLSNNAGGILGGISTGQPLVVRVAVKPIPSVGLPQETVNCAGEDVDLEIAGRHDVCAIPRINPVLKAMLALTLADFALLHAARCGALPCGTFPRKATP